MPGDPDESQIIARILQLGPEGGRHRPPPHPAAAPGDDAALVGPGLVVTVDTMMEGVHWDDRLSAEDVGWKLVAVNASDIGAMGGRPTWALLSISLPAPADAAWLEGFSRGLGQALGRYGARLVGGDTTRSPGPIALSLTMAGQAPRPLPRSGGRPGDQLWVSGTLGEAAGGFFDGAPPGLSWWRRPEPPVELGAAIAEAGLAHAMMDLSDGLLVDLGRLCAASGCGARVDPLALPVGPALATLDPALRLQRQVAFGEDFQLLLAAPADQAEALAALARGMGLRLSCIGTLTEAPGLVLSTGEAWPAPAFAHFPATPAPGDPA